MNIFITGATGYIGHKIALLAATRYQQVHILVRNPDASVIPRSPGIYVYKGDLADRAAIVDGMAGCEHVIHCAGFTRLYAKNRELFYQINVEGTRNVLDCATQLKVKRIVYTSSCAVAGPSYAHPVKEEDPRLTGFENDYETSKAWAEQLVLDYCRRGLHGVIVSPSRVYGPGLHTQGNPITSFVKAALKRKFAMMPSRKEVIGNYVYIDDVVEGHLLALQYGRKAEKYHLGGENISYDQFFQQIKNNARARIKIIQVPTALLYFSAYVQSALSATGMYNSHLNTNVVTRLLESRAISSEKAIQEWQYRITPFAVGMKKTIDSLHQN